MPSEEGILGCWALLQGSGLPRPWLTEEEAEQGLSSWLLVLDDVDDRRLIALTVAWLRSPDARYGRWPVPGALLAALGEPDDIDDADEAWAEVLALLAWRGRERCPGTTAELEDLRGRLAAAAQAAECAGDAERARRARAHASRLPRSDERRTLALLAGVAACGGWRALGSCEEEAIVAHRASFRSAYRAQRQRSRLTDGERRIEGLLGSHLRLIPGGS